LQNKTADKRMLKMCYEWIKYVLILFN
jgi:hypothetical protein